MYVHNTPFVSVNHPTVKGLMCLVQMIDWSSWVTSQSFVYDWLKQSSDWPSYSAWRTDWPGVVTNLSWFVHFCSLCLMVTAVTVEFSNCTAVRCRDSSISSSSSLPTMPCRITALHSAMPVIWLISIHFCIFSTGFYKPLSTPQNIEKKLLLMFTHQVCNSQT